MIIDETLLWSKLESFSPNNPYDALSFSQRLAQENGWPPLFTDRVIFEYKRFLFLCTISPHPVTPSDEVDQAWHLHLAYTKSYWNDLCKDILGKDLHHTPTTGGPAERDKFLNYYESTLQLYHDKFGQAPPDDIWPPSHKRFGTADFVRANKDTHWVIPKKPWQRNMSGLTLIALGFVITFVSGNPAFTILLGACGLIIMAGINNKRSCKAEADVAAEVVEEIVVATATEDVVVVVVVDVAADVEEETKGHY